MKDNYDSKLSKLEKDHEELKTFTKMLYRELRDSHCDFINLLYEMDETGLNRYLKEFYKREELDLMYHKIFGCE